jgi:hypothetical protein
MKASKNRAVKEREGEGGEILLFKGERGKTE